MATLSEQIAKALRAKDVGPAVRRLPAQATPSWETLNDPQAQARLRELLRTGQDPATATFEPRLQRTSQLQTFVDTLGQQLRQQPLAQLLGFGEEPDPLQNFMKVGEMPDLPTKGSGRAVARKLRSDIVRSAAGKQSAVQKAVLTAESGARHGRASGPLGIATTPDIGAHTVLTPAAVRSPLAVAPIDIVDGRSLVSVRMPTAKKAPSASELLTVGLPEVYQSPELTRKLAAQIRNTNLLTQQQRGLSDRGVLEAAKETASNNLRFMANVMSPEERGINAQWYRGGGNLITDTGSPYGLTPEASTAIGATQSPQKDWFQNLALAERIMRHGTDFIRGKAGMPAFNSDLFQMHAERVREAARNTAKEARRGGAKSDTIAKILAEAEATLENRRHTWLNKSYEELPELGRAALVRHYSELVDPSSYMQYAPTGEALGLARTKGKKGKGGVRKEGAPNELVWQSNSAIAKALSILHDPSMENVSQQLGLGHKVRSFYNNLLVPLDPRSVTADTHAIGAAHLSPFGSKSPIVLRGLGGGAENSVLGIRGTYPVYSDAYKAIAPEFRVAPSGMQSIVWDAQKRLFSPEQKRNVALEREVQRIWNEYENGQMTLERAQNAVVEAAMNADKRSTPLLPALWTTK